MNPDDKDFLLALYNKLWENINNKDSRLWTFLSIYAAAVGLAFGVGQLAGGNPIERASRDLYASAVILLLTLWALFILLNATWWDQRNRLLVEQIEKKFASAVAGVIPSAYRAEIPRLDWLNAVSVKLIVLVELVVYLKSMWSFFAPGTITSFEQLFLLVSLYLLTIGGVWWWVARQEGFIQQYFSTIELLRRDSGNNAPITAEQIRRGRRFVDWRWWALVFFVLVTILFDVVFFSNVQGYQYACVARIVVLVVQLLALLQYVLRAWNYYTINDVNAAESYSLDLLQGGALAIALLILFAAFLLPLVVWLNL